MRIVNFKVPQTAREAFRLQHDRLPYFYDRLHHHTEWQLMHVINGHGTLIAGDYVGRFEEGDVFLIASGQPHVFRCDDQFYQEGTGCESVSIYFNEDYLGSHFWELNEMNDTRLWLERAVSSLRFYGHTRDRVRVWLGETALMGGIARLIRFFEIMDDLTRSNECTPLSAVAIPNSTGREGKRMNDILQFTFRESHRKIYLEEVAKIANLSIEAFCRYFKLSTGKTYATFLNDLRISRACRLLAQEERTIQQVCFESGFNNLSNFNRIFKKSTGHQPSQYAKMARLRRA